MIRRSGAFAAVSPEEPKDDFAPTADRPLIARPDRLGTLTLLAKTIENIRSAGVCVEDCGKLLEATRQLIEAHHISEDEFRTVRDEYSAPFTAFVSLVAKEAKSQLVGDALVRAVQDQFSKPSGNLSAFAGPDQGGLF